MSWFTLADILRSSFPRATGLGHRLDSDNYQYSILGIDNLVIVRYNLSLLIDPGELMALGLSNLTVSGKAAAGTVVGPLERH